MLTITNQKGEFKVRVAAVIRQKGRVLLLNEPLVGSYWFLPGGRAEMHESTDETLFRELKEEMNVTAKIGALLWVVENFYTFSGVAKHVLGFYYSVEIPESHSLSREEEYFAKRAEDGIIKQFHFRWVTIDDIEKKDIRPPFIKKLLQNPVDETRVSHFVDKVIEDSPKA